MRPVDSVIIRSPRSEDAHAIYKLAAMAKSGLSNLPKTLEAAQAMVDHAIQSLTPSVATYNKTFLFILEDTSTNEVIGLSGIKARTGTKRPYYTFVLHDNIRHPYLELQQQWHGPSELGSLFLSPDHRSRGLGRLLSLARFMFMHVFPDFFTSVIVAELRGFLFQNNASPVWNALGRKFIRRSFTETDKHASQSLTFIDKYFPKYPIYLALLPTSCHPYFKRVHPNTENAKKLLLSEHFLVSNQVDIFDGGPILSSLRTRIRTVQSSRFLPIHALPNVPIHEPHLICNHSLDSFRVMKITDQTPHATIYQRLGLSDPNQLVSIVPERSRD